MEKYNFLTPKKSNTMSTDLTKKAVEMLLNGATLVSQPCPYCKGVRVIKDGNALCINCVKQPEEKTEEIVQNDKQEDSSTALKTLEKKLDKLTEELASEPNHEKQQSILKSINSLVEIIGKMKN